MSRDRPHQYHFPSNMLLTILIYLLITNGIEMQGVENKSCLQLDSICSINDECCDSKCNQAAGRHFSTCESKTNIRFDKILLNEPLMADHPRYCFPGKHYCLGNDDCCSGKCIPVGIPPSYLLTAQFCSS